MEYIADPDWKADDVRQRHERHQLLLTPYYVSTETERVDFDKIKNQPLLIKNYVFSGLIIMLDEYYKMYKRLVNPTTPKDNIDIKLMTHIYPKQQWVHKVLSAGLSLLLGTDIHIVINHEWKLIECIKDEHGSIQKHLQDMALFLGLEEPYYLTSFIMIPEPYPAQVTRWGSCVWILRMYYIYFAKVWKKINMLQDVANFLQHMVLLLPCRICTYHAIYDPIKLSVLKVQNELLTTADEGFIQHVMALEIFFHQRVNIITYPSESKVTQNVETLMPMYMDLFNNLFLYIKNGFKPTPVHTS